MSRYPRPDLSKVLEHHSIDEARADLVEVDKEFDVVPRHARTAIHRTVDTLIEHAHELGLLRLDQVVNNAGILIAAASGVRRQDHGRPLPPDQADALHLYRNTLLALVLAGVISYSGDAAQITAAFPKPKQRTRAMLRPHTDDETLLMRMWALHLSQGDKNNRRAAAVYAQCDAGLVPGETTKVRTSDIDLTPGDAMIVAPGLEVGVADRLLPLEEYAASLLRRYVHGAAPTGGSRLTYRPRSGDYDYERALSSAIGVIDRIRDAVGLTQHDTTNASVWMWRAASTELVHGISAAVAVSGRSSADNLRALLRDRPRPAGKRPTNNNKPRTLGLS